MRLLEPSIKKLIDMEPTINDRMRMELFMMLLPEIKYPKAFNPTHISRMCIDNVAIYTVVVPDTHFL
jgi:hypothetical protein